MLVDEPTIEAPRAAPAFLVDPARPEIAYWRAAPTVLAALIAAAYLVVSPASYDLAAHLLRAKLFSVEGFGLWNNWWYGGHDTLGYSVVFPPLAAATSPQLIGAIAVVATAALFEPIAYARYGSRSLIGSLWFALGATVDLFCGRLPFALGVMFGVAAMLALQRRRPVLAGCLCLLAAISSPVAGLFTALAGATFGLLALWERRPRDVAVGAWLIAASLGPVLALSILFPEGGTEPYAFISMWPVPLICILFAVLLPAEERGLRIGAVLYGLATVLAWSVHSAVGGNAGRLEPLVAGPLMALMWWRRRTAWMLLAAVGLLYLQWQEPAHDVISRAENPAVNKAYWRPLLGFLERQHGGPFRIEIPFTSSHWEAYYVAPKFAIARGWERQLDERDNPIFYNGTLDAATYKAWLHRLAIRYVAVANTELDESAKAEVRLIDSGLPYLRLIRRTNRFRIYAVVNPTPIAQGPVTLTGYGPNSLTLRAHARGHVLLHVRWSPYWKLSEGSGCVQPAGSMTALRLRHPGPVKLSFSFSLGRVGSRSPRCSG